MSYSASKLILCAVVVLSTPVLGVDLVYPNGIAFDGQGELYISDIGTHQVLKFANGKLSVVAGTGDPGFSGDGGPAANAQLFAPHDIVFDRDGNLLIADSLNHRIRRIDKAGVITTVAGTGKSGYTGDSGPATKADFNSPQAVVFDAEGRLVIADTYNHVVRRIDRHGTVSTVAGSEPGLSGDDGPATKARLSIPGDVAMGADGCLYIAEGGNSRIRRVRPDGTLDTIAGYGPGSGSGGAGLEGDNGPAAKAKLFSPGSLQFAANGDLYISDTGNSRIRRIREGTISTVAGAEEGSLHTPQKIRHAPDGRLFVADRGNARVRVIDNSGRMTTVVGGAQPQGITLTFMKP